MILRLESSTSRWVFFVASVLLAAPLSYFSLRSAWAEHLAESGTREALERATQLEPGDARNWYLLGRDFQYNLEAPDNARAIAAYRQALSFDPRSPAVWLDLAEAHETQGDLASARDAFLEAERSYPISAAAAWRYGNYLLRQGEFAAAFTAIRRAVEEEPGRAAEATSRCWRANPDIQMILDTALPASRNVYLDGIGVLARGKATDAALAVWSRLVRLHPKIELKEAYPFLEVLIQQRELAGARTVWNQALELSGAAWPADPSGSLIFDGGFETDTTGGGFAWRIQPRGAEVGYDGHVKHSGSRSLSVRFDGTQNVAFDGVCQYVPVDPRTSYQFSAWIRAEAVTTDRGVSMRLLTPESLKNPPLITPDLKGTVPWTQVTLPWRAEKDVHLLQVCVTRAPSRKFDNKIAGTVWLDDVSLVPAPPEHARAQSAQKDKP